MRVAEIIAQPDLSSAEIGAARLDGHLYPLGLAHRPVDLPDTPSARAASLHGLPAAAIACGPTAAWIWGALDALPRRLELTFPTGATLPRALPTPAICHERLILSDDLRRFPATVAVTTPLRTAIDLVRVSGERYDEACVGRLLRIAGIQRSDLIAAVEARRRLPGRHRALARLRRPPA